MKHSILLVTLLMVAAATRLFAQQTDSISNPADWDFSPIENYDHSSRMSINLKPDLNFALVFTLGAADQSPHIPNYFAEVEFSCFNLNYVPRGTRWWFDYKFSIGLSRMHFNRLADVDTDGHWQVGVFPESVDECRSEVTSIFADNTFMAHRGLRKGRSFAFGFSMRAYDVIQNTMARTVTTDLDGQRSVVLNEISSMRPFQWSAVAQMFLNQNFYIKAQYSPWDQYHSGAGPAYHPLSIGFGLKF